LHNYDYVLKRSQIDAETRGSTDTARLARLVELGFWCRSVGLDEKAKKEFLYVLNLEPENALAMQGMGLYARASLKSAEERFAARDFVSSRRLAQSTIDDYPDHREVVDAAATLIEKIQNESMKAERAKGAKAEELAQLGNELRAEADQHIARILDTTVDRSRTRIPLYAEAERCLTSAIENWQKALRIDPSMGISPEWDLNNKIMEAQRTFANLRPNRPLPLQPGESSLYRTRRY
jgi:tetratricopeptide (TPR) repeat protein